jgi:hypothetical protein
MPTDQKSRGFAEVFLILLVVLFAIFLAGGVFNKEKPKVADITNTASSSGEIRGACCDLGDGDECKPHTDDAKTLTFGGEKYGLLKSKVSLMEGNYHLRNTGEKHDDDPIIVNTTDLYYHICPLDPVPGRDKIFTTDGNGCMTVPNDEIIYVCKENCTDQVVDPRGFCGREPGLSCYGQPNTIYDIYFRLSDYPSPGVPTSIKQCKQAGSSIINPKSAFIVLPPDDGPAKEDLQLKNLRIKEIPAVVGSSTWVSPWCKPAIYLYPQSKMNVNVKIAPQGNLTLTIPKYPLFGWDVTANPDGHINYYNQIFPYLYYEAEIPDKLINVPQDGFVVEPSQLASKLDVVLNKLGLNDNERKDFIAYWVKALPKSNYYFFGVISQNNLDQMTPLIITPTPNKTIRVTLYFEALDEPRAVNDPLLTTPNRNGFTVVEWGGIFKKDKKHNFSCLM